LPLSLDDACTAFAAEIAKLSEQEKRIFKNRLKRRKANETLKMISFCKLFIHNYFIVIIKLFRLSAGRSSTMCNKEVRRTCGQCRHVFNLLF
jgi:hypothetical protein